MAKRKPKFDPFALLNAGAQAVGYWVDVKSSWVRSVRFENRRLSVRFRDGAVCHYDNIGITTYLAMLESPSKGTFVWEHLYHLPYTLG